jgi:SRSO17 transposase
LREQELLPFKYVAADSIYGSSPDFIDAIEERPGTIYFVTMPSDTLCWRERPATETKTYKYKGENRSKKIVPKTEKTPVSFIDLANSIHSFFWYRRKVGW